MIAILCSLLCVLGICHVFTGWTASLGNLYRHKQEYVCVYVCINCPPLLLLRYYIHFQGGEFFFVDVSEVCVINVDNSVL